MKLFSSVPLHSLRAARDTIRPGWHVLKFGGSSFLDLRDYRRVAGYVHRRASDPTSRVVVVVSGMSGTTGSLLEAALAIDSGLQPAVQDQILATAEMVSASFLRAALHAQGCPSLDLWAPQLGIRSDGAATGAQISAIDPRPVLEALEHDRVVVVAGGQAVDSKGRITMLGRNSSDLTAVALAAALGTGKCEIFSDVPGVYTADPYVVPSARLLPRVSYQQCAAMSEWGAKVLHWGAVHFAALHNVKIVCRALEAGDDNLATRSRGSIIGAGRGATAVVGDGRARLYRVSNQVAPSVGPNGFPIDPIVAALHTAGISVARVMVEDDLVLAFPGGQSSVDYFLTGAGVAAEPVEGLGLVSVVEPDGVVHQQLVPVDEVDSAVRELHEQQHGTHSAVRNGQSPLRPKRRSPYSGLLFQGTTGTTAIPAASR